MESGVKPDTAISVRRVAFRHHIHMFALHLLGGTPPPQQPKAILRAACVDMLSRPEGVETWLSTTYDNIYYEAVLFGDDDAEADEDDLDDASSDEFIYGETGIPFFLQLLDTALLLAQGREIAGQEAGTQSRGFVDLGGGKGQLALAAALSEPHRLSGSCRSLELMPELHRIAQAAFAVAANDEAAAGMSRVEAIRGSIYDVETLKEACADVAVAFAYASKFDAQRLSKALGPFSLPSSAVVITVNGQLGSGWEEVAPAMEDEAPTSESSAVARFWRRSVAA